jgi:hypothetical protein
MTDRDHRAETPRSEPEILPPRGQRGRPIWIAVDEQDSTRRVYVARPGPFTIIMALAILGFIALVMLIVLLSVALIWIPFVIILIAAFVLSMYWRRFRAWLTGR